MCQRSPTPQVHLRSEGRLEFNQFGMAYHKYLFRTIRTLFRCLQRVLVTEYIDGYKINDIENLKSDGFSLADLNNKLFGAFGYQIFLSGFVHADPHPGNSELIYYTNMLLRFI